MDTMTRDFEGLMLFLLAMLAAMSLAIALVAAWAGRRRIGLGQWRRALDLLYTFANQQADTDEGRAKIAACTNALARPFGRIEKHLQGKEWLMGGRFTVADIALAECVRYAQSHAPSLEAFPNLRAWIARCQARPAFQTMIAQRNAEPA